MHRKRSFVKIMLLLLLILMSVIALSSCRSYGTNIPSDTPSDEPSDGRSDAPSVGPSDGPSYTSSDEPSDEAGAAAIPVLTYHKIVPAGTEFSSSLLVDERDFEKQMKYLHDNGFTTLSLDEFYDWYNGKEFPEKSVVITFDDGYYGVYYLAYPIIRKYGLTATEFCIGHLIDECTHEWEPDSPEDYRIGADVIDKVREEYPRFGFESHTYDMHRKIRGWHPVDLYDYDKIMADIDKNAGFGFSYLAYPWGDYNDTFKQALSDSGYKMAFTYRTYYYATRNDDPYAINRIKISGNMSFAKFKDIVNRKAAEPIDPDA